MLASRLVLSFCSSRARRGMLGLALAVAAACGDTTADQGNTQPQNGDGDGDQQMMGDPTGPIEAEDGSWTYVEFPNTYCRDGSAAGIVVAPKAGSKNLMIYLEGGGACYDTLTCFANPSSVISSVKTNPINTGLFDRENAENPVRDWNIVYVPYCTGDVHSGANPDGKIDGIQQRFVGYTNITAFLKRIAPTFPEVDNVLLTGISAGGFGASANVKQVMDAFPDAKGNLLDDSGPAMSSEYVTPCLQQKWVDLWSLDKGMLLDCGDACPDTSDYLLDFALHMAKTYNDRKSGLIESQNDAIITSFFGVGLNECSGVFGSASADIPADKFKMGLLDFREAVKEYPNFGTWYPEGITHTWLQSNNLYSATIGDKKLIDWVTDIVQNKAASHVGE